MHMAGAWPAMLSIYPARKRTGREIGLDRVVHLELDRVRGVLEIVHLFPLQLDVGLDEIAIENIALQQEGMVVLQLAERVAQRAANGWDVLQLFRRQVVEVFVHWV